MGRAGRGDREADGHTNTKRPDAVMDDFALPGCNAVARE